jgi:hypothetical protein
VPIDCEVHDVAVMEVSRMEKRVADLEIALRDCVPFLVVHMVKYATDFQLPALHPVHAEIIDRVSRLTGGEPLADKINPTAT